MRLSALVVSIFKSDPDVTCWRNVFFIPTGTGLLLFLDVFKFFRTETSICGNFQSSLRACRFIQDSLHLDWSCSLTVVCLTSKCGPDSNRVYRYRRRNTKFRVTNSTHFKFLWYYSWGWLQTFRRIWTKIFAGVLYTWSKDPLWSTNLLLVIHTCFGSK